MNMLSATGLRSAVFSLCLLGLAACGGESAESLLKSAKDYLAKNDNKAAVIQLKSALQKNPDSGEARFLLGKALYDGGDAAAANVELRKALDLRYDESLAIPLLARSLITEGQPKTVLLNYERTTLPDPKAQADLKTSVAIAHGMAGASKKAEDALQEALAAGPDFAPALRFQARLKADARDFDGALALLDKVLAKDAADAEAWHLKGELMAFGKQDAAGAEAAYRKALAAKPNYVPSYTRLITLLLGKNEIAGAKEQLELLRKQLPNQPQTVYLEALVLVAERNFTGAREKTQALLRAAPNNVNVLQLAGSIELQLNSLLQAETYLNKVLSAAPGSVGTRRQLAQIAMRSGQSDKALKLLEPLLEKPTSTAADYGLAAEAYLMAGDEKKATEYFARTAKLDPKDVRSRTALALSRMGSGNAEEAFNALESIAASDSGAFADLALVAAHIRRREFDQALKALDGIEKKRPDRPQVSVLRARVNLLRNDQPGARKNFERALQLDPKFFPAVAGLAAIDLANKKPEDAKQRFEALLKADPQNAQAMVALASLTARAGGSKEDIAAQLANAVKAKPGEPGPRLVQINQLLANKDFKAAMAAAQDGVAALPNNPDLLDALGRAQALAGDTNQAMTSFNKLAALQPQSPLPFLRMAEMQVNATNLDGAVQNLKKALGVSPNLLQAQRALIQVELAAQRPDEAVLVARAVQKQRPTDGTGYLMEGEIEMTRKGWPAAESALRAGLKQAPAATDLGIRLHNVLSAAGKPAEADKFAIAWLKDHPKDTRFVMFLGDLALSRNKLADAESRYREVLKLQPENPLAMNNVAWLLASQKKPGALPLAEKAAELLPEAPAVLDTLALALAEDNQMPKAVETMKKALALAPGNPGLQLNLARIYIRAGDKAAAKTELEALAKLGDKFPGQAAVSELMKTL